MCQIQKIITITKVKELTAYIFFRRFMVSGLNIELFNPFSFDFGVWYKIVTLNMFGAKLSTRKG